MSKRSVPGMGRVTDAEHRAYWKGVATGRSHAKAMMNCMRICNRTLLDLCNVIEVYNPVGGVTISHDLAQDIVRALKRGHVGPKTRKQLERAMQAAGSEYAPILESVRAQLTDMANQ